MLNVCSAMLFTLCFFDGWHERKVESSVEFVGGVILLALAFAFKK